MRGTRKLQRNVKSAVMENIAEVPYIAQRLAATYGTSPAPRLRPTKSNAEETMVG